MIETDENCESTCGKGKTVHWLIDLRLIYVQD